MKKPETKDLIKQIAELKENVKSLRRELAKEMKDHLIVKHKYLETLKT